MSTTTRGAVRRALVTGASSGIGAATARVLAAQGYRVALLARRRERLEALAEELAQASGGPPLVLVADLARPEDIARAFAELSREFGALELLVNNAGMGYRARVRDLDPQLLGRLFATNVEAPLLCCQQALPLLSRGTRPCVVNVSSVVGRRGMPTMAAYAASKAALCSVGESLRLEWAAQGIRVCTLNPGVTATEIFAVQPNPEGLHDPDLALADAPELVGRHILELDREGEPERFLRWKWRWLGALSVLAPRWADRLMQSRDWIPKDEP